MATLRGHAFLICFAALVATVACALPHATRPERTMDVLPEIVHSHGNYLHSFTLLVHSDDTVEWQEHTDHATPPIHGRLSQAERRRLQALIHAIPPELPATVRPSANDELPWLAPSWIILVVAGKELSYRAETPPHPSLADLVSELARLERRLLKTPPHSHMGARGPAAPVVRTPHPPRRHQLRVRARPEPAETASRAAARICVMTRRISGK